MLPLLVTHDFKNEIIETRVFLLELLSRYFYIYIIYLSSTGSAARATLSELVGANLELHKSTVKVHEYGTNSTKDAEDPRCQRTRSSEAPSATKPTSPDERLLLTRKPADGVVNIHIPSRIPSRLGQ